jgi:hypothetical protein
MVYKTFHYFDFCQPDSKDPLSSIFPVTAAAMRVQGVALPHI